MTRTTNGKVAIIDLGSNSIRMIVMKISENGAYRMIDQAKDSARLSAGMADEDRLGRPAMERALETLGLFRKLIDSHQVERVLGIATAAVRNSSNGKAFLERVRLETGLEFTVVSGEKESYYDYLGVINTLDVRDCLILDTGGGSTEIVQVENRRLVNAVSIPYGAVVLTEGLLKGGDPTRADLKRTEVFLAARVQEIPWLRNLRGTTIVGLGGSIRNLAKIHRNQKGFDQFGLHNYAVGAADVEATYELITSLRTEDRRKIQGIGKDRADIIVGGLIPLKAVMDWTRAERLLIGGHGLRDGVFFDGFHEECGMKNAVVEDVLEHSLLNTMRIYEANIPHANHVRELSLAMFDQLRELHGLNDTHRRLLSVGALLHDIGLYVGYYDHHAHGFYLALHSEIDGLSHRELIQSAFVIALHRNEDFKRDWTEFGLYMDRTDYEAVLRLGLLVRIAEGLDRNEYGYVEGLQCRVGKHSVEMVLATQRIADVEIASARLAEKEFKKRFGKDLQIGYR